MSDVIYLPYKEKKTAEQLVNDVFTENGVKFELISRKAAIPYLEDRNYYYKLACYRKNFRRDKKDKYINLDFQHLIDLSKIDRDFRYILLQMTLEIEHFLKVFILRDISYNKHVDGYAIVNDYISSFNAKHDKKISIKILVERGKKQNSVNYGIYNKVSTNNYYIAIWQLLEILQLYELEYFFDYYFSRYKNSSINASSYKSLLISSRYIRNAAAHNSPILVNVASSPSDGFTNTGVNDKYINKSLKPHFTGAKIDLAIKPTHRFRDIASVFKLYSLLRIAPTSSSDSIVNSLESLLNTINAKPPFPNLNNDMNTFFSNIRKLFINIYK